MFQQFILRQAINLVVSLVVSIVDKHRSEFDIQAAKEQIKEKVRDIVPPSMWGEQFVEDRVIGVTNWMIESLDKGFVHGAKLAEGVLNALANQDLNAAIEAVKQWYLSILDVSVQAVGEAKNASPEMGFADLVIGSFDAQQGGSEMAKSNDPGVNSLGAQQQQGERAEASETVDPLPVEAAKEAQAKADEGAQQVAQEMDAKAKATEQAQASMSGLEGEQSEKPLAPSNAKGK